MVKTVSGNFATRRDAEMTVERLVQEQGIDRTDIFIASASTENSAGIKKEGADAKRTPLDADRDSEPALTGLIEVSVEIEDSDIDVVCASFREFGADNISIK